jgi:hypothetical protein
MIGIQLPTIHAEHGLLGRSTLQTLQFGRIPTTPGSDVSHI